MKPINKVNFFVSISSQRRVSIMFSSERLECENNICKLIKYIDFLECISVKIVNKIYFTIIIFLSTILETVQPNLHSAQVVVKIACANFGRTL